MPQNAQIVQHRSDEQREYERITTALLGKLFVPAEEITLDCQIINLSVGGAGIRCAEPPPLQTFAVLYIDGFGRFEGVVTRYIAGELGMSFVCKEAKRQRLQRDLTAYICGGQLVTTKLRRHQRAPSASFGHFIRSNGEYVRCDVLDISFQGISLRTDRFPPIGEIINLGQTCGRVVRHNSDGIAIHFLNAVPPPDTLHGD